MGVQISKRECTGRLGEAAQNGNLRATTNASRKMPPRLVAFDESRSTTKTVFASVFSTCVNITANVERRDIGAK